MSHPGRPNWTDEQWEIAKQHFDLHTPYREISRLIGRSAKAIQDKRRLMGYWMQPKGKRITDDWKYTPEIEAYIRDKWVDKQWSCGRIAQGLSEEFNRPFSKNQVVGKIYRLGLNTGTNDNRRKPLFALPRPSRKGIKMGPRRPGPAPLPAIAIVVQPVGGRWNLQDNPGCRYPEGDSPDWWFCGAPRVDHSSYCGYHHSVCYQTHRFKQRPSVPLPGAVGPLTTPTPLATVGGPLS